jgi:hypothetical protein
MQFFNVRAAILIITHLLSRVSRRNINASFLDPIKDEVP